MERDEWEAGLENGRGALDLSSKQMRAQTRTVAPIFAADGRKSDGWFIRLFSKPLSRSGSQEHEWFVDGRTSWTFRSSFGLEGWFEMTGTGPMPGQWSWQHPPFLLELLPRVHDLRELHEQETIRGVPCNWYGGTVDLNWLRQQRRDRPTWFVVLKADDLDESPFAVAVSEDGVVRRISAISLPTGDKLPYWRHIDLFDFGIPFEAPDVGAPPRRIK